MSREGEQELTCLRSLEAAIDKRLLGLYRGAFHWARGSAKHALEYRSTEGGEKMVTDVTECLAGDKKKMAYHGMLCEDDYVRLTLLEELKGNDNVM